MFKLFKKKEPEAVFIDLVPQPKVLRAPKLKPTTCEFCKAVYQGDVHNLSTGVFSMVKRVIRCPVCDTENLAEFEEGEGFDVDKISELIAKDTKTYPILLRPNKYTRVRHIVCPHCRGVLQVNGDKFIKLKDLGEIDFLYITKHCKDCGQALDWSSLTEEENTDGNV